MQSTLDSPPVGHASATRSHAAPLILAVIVLAPLFWSRLSRPAAFGAYWESGSAAVQHLDPYGQYPLVGKSFVIFGGQQRAVADINMNPPCLLPVFQALAHLGLSGFAAAWTLVSVACFAAAIFLLLRHSLDLRGPRVAWLCLCSAVLDTVLSGQIYFVLLLLAVVGLIGIEQRRDLKAAIGMGFLVAIKPTFVFWPLFVGASGRRSAAAKSFAVTALVWGLAWAIYGSRIYASWFRVLRADNHWIEATDIALPAWFARMGLPHVGLVFGGLLATGLALLVWRYRPSAAITSGLGLIAGVLCAPLAWAAYVLLAAPAFVSTSWGRLAKTAAMCLAVPAVAIVVLVRDPAGVMLAAGAVYTTGACLLLAHFIASATRTFGAGKSTI